MRRIIVLGIIGVLGSITLSYAQTSVKLDQDLAGVNNIPKETVFVHHNTTLLFAGERLYYKVYGLTAKTKRLSSLSKMGYVALIGENGNTVFSHKVKLDSGLGYGDFLVPTDIPSGNYKLIGYTNWMKNEGQAYFFQDDIGIINPYLENQSAILAKKDNTLPSALMDSTPSVKPLVTPEVILPKRKTNQYLSLSTDKGTYASRSLVRVTIDKIGSGNVHGNYSLSVRKLDHLEHGEKLTAEGFSKKLNQNGATQAVVDKEIYLPELRGELISGTVLLKENNTPAANKRVAVAIPGDDFIVQVGNTNSQGKFFLNLDKTYSGVEAIVEVLGEDRDQYTLSLDTHGSFDHNNLSFKELRINAEMKEQILERSIFNQVENAYIEQKANTLTPLEESIPFYRNFVEVYDLDDYTRFKTLRETMVEIIDHVWFKRVGGGAFMFQVRGYDPFIDTGILPLVVVDGFLVQAHNDLVNYNSKKVDKVALLREKFRIGAHTFQGMVAIETINGDYKPVLNGEHIKKITLFKPQPAKQYFLQQYSQASNSESDRIPDFRNQLLWIPNLTFDTNSSTFEFFTSDNTGNYEIALEGFTKDGIPISIREIIQVE
ncbi:hypothetical protein [Spongiimicrobium sp. 3-5]|uniref:hypothetical protein n=1 Tax=Spongiimicrobium sp. 3-5 TaxID=3332596 RepID=UPI0039811F64